MKNKRLIWVIPLSLFFFWTLSACAVLDEILPEVRHVTLVEESVYPQYYLDDFDLRTLQLRVITRNWDTQIIDVQAYMLSPEDREKIKQAGHHRITIRYRGQNLVFDLILRQRIHLHRSDYLYETIG